MNQKLATCCLLFATLGGTGHLQAAVLDYSAAASATVTITSISPTPVPVNVFFINAPLPVVSPPIEEISGNATVMTDGTANSIGDPMALGVGDGYIHTTSASGTADGPAPASSFAFSLASGQILVDNETNDVTVTVEFLLTYTLSATASGGGSAQEDTYSFSDVQLNWGSSNGVSDFFIDTAASDDRFGDPTMVSSSFAFSIVVPPWTVGNASLQTASSGYADITAVPVPAAFWLFASACGFLVRFRRD